MASTVDFDALRAQTMGAGNDEAVTVNTRALIDKVLARYSGEWTTLRELLQNAADASASKVAIRFETLPSATVAVPQSSEPSIRLKHVLLNHHVKSMIVENNGDTFQDHDWARLKKIAEGNPDETKIGAFGVGFYSVFADCEEPFVSSGNQALAFYWQKDSLFTKKLALPDGQSTNTTFVLPMRNQSSPIPPLLSLCQFLTSSLTFVGLESIELNIDGWSLAAFKKKIAPGLDLQIPKGVENKSREGLMHILRITKEAAQVDARWLKVVEWKPKAAPLQLKDTGTGSGLTTKGAYSTHSLRGFFSRLAPSGSNSAALEKAAKEEQIVQEELEEDLLGESTATVFIHVNKATVRTAVNLNFATELERATKKPPPKYTTVSLLSTSYDEHVASSSSMDKAFSVPRIFRTFIPINGKGKIFIGFTTNQTTGFNIHISTPSVIPTVERESIDLNNRFVRVWNVELLRVAGIVARVSWAHETNELKDKLARAMKSKGRHQADKEDIASVLPEALFLHNTFTMNESTPSAEVGTIIEEAFWTCNQKTTIATLSSRGVISSSEIRISEEELGFIDNIPTLPEGLEGVGLVKKLIEYGVITPVTMTDIKTELEAKALNGSQLQKFLEWLGHKARISEIDGTVVRSLLNVAVANDDGEMDGRPIELRRMKNFLNVSRIPPEMPLPPTTLPFKYTMKMSKADMELLGFEDLQMVPWLRWLMANIGGSSELSANYDITKTPGFASSVLPVISKQWDGLSASSKAAVIELLSPRTVIPTKMGMKLPVEAYFPSVKLFDDLPVITGIQGVKEKFLSQLGVRKTVEIGVVFERLIEASPSTALQASASSSRWSHVDLIKYLASVRNDIPPADIARLRSVKIWPAEIEALQPTKERYLVSEIFEPNQATKRLRLPTLQWPGIYRPESNEGRFLTFLGLRVAPSYEDLVRIMSNAASIQDLELRDRALRYFIDHHQTNRYAHVDHPRVTLAYLPIQGSETKVATPDTCFSNERASLLGFNILHRDLHAHALKFGVDSDPPMSECINRLEKSPPKSRKDAREVFSYFASRLSSISNEQAGRLTQARIVPVVSKSKRISTVVSTQSERLEHIAPQICFLGNGDKYADIFDYVDFGQEANTFLLRVGSKHEPSTVELTKLLVREPAKVFSVLGDSRYLELLRSVAASWRTLRKDKALVKDMRNSKCLLAYREIRAQSDQADKDDDEDSGIKAWELATAGQIVIVDDIITYNLFRSSLLAAPMEEALEDFYHSLGSPEVASIVEEYQSIGVVAKDESQALKLQRLIQERARLFLADYLRELIKHDAKWIEQNLRVKCVRSLSLRKSLQGYNLSHTEKRSAVLHNDKPILYVTAGGYDMLEVSQALVPVLLQRAKPQSMFMFEMILESSLQKLRSRGYNVARLLNQKATEARIAEEARMRQLAEEEQQMREREAAWKQANAAKAQKQISMPGVFPDSPDRQHPHSSRPTPPVADQPERPGPRGFLSGITRQFGFDKHSPHNNHSSRASDRVSEIPHQDAPPPYSQQVSFNSQTKVPEPETVTAPHQLQQNLVNAIQRSRVHNSTSVASQPSVNEVKETASYCDSKPGHDISFVGEITGVRVFLSNGAVANGMPAGRFLEANASGLKLFVSLLLDCADIYSLQRDTVHIFYDDAGSTIAFNQNRALFFNYRYFDNLHLPTVQQGKNAEAVVYWSVVMAHELAHNLVSDHSAQHSYYTEALVVQYFPKMAGKAAGQESLTTRSTTSAVPSISLSSQPRMDQGFLDID